MTEEIALRPSYWASVSGGKDSLYMLNLILHNLDRYPLDGVVHFELEIDYPLSMMLSTTWNPNVRGLVFVLCELNLVKHGRSGSTTSVPRQGVSMVSQHGQQGGAIVPTSWTQSGNYPNG